MCGLQKTQQMSAILFLQVEVLRRAKAALFVTHAGGTPRWGVSGLGLGLCQCKPKQTQQQGTTMSPNGEDKIGFFTSTLPSTLNP